MKKENRDADLRWIHGVIVQAAWFVKASLGQNAQCVPAFLLATVDLPLPRRSLAMLGRWTAASGQLSKKIPAQRGDSFIYMQVHDVPPEPENGYDLCIRHHFLSHIHQYDESIHQAMKY